MYEWLEWESRIRIAELRRMAEQEALARAAAAARGRNDIRCLMRQSEDGRKRRCGPICGDPGGWETMTPEKAAKEAEEALALGLLAIKVKVGRGDLAADLDAIRAVRRAVGDGIPLMVG